ncbi:MAG: penicillin-binding protein [Oscillospiraceae bacterium]|nr:penicillin-binding protein [Oscillospiraceae bacterium]
MDMTNAISSTGVSVPVKKGKKRRKTPLILRILKKIGLVILVTLLSFLLLFIIIGVICGLTATAYVVNYMESTNSVSIQEMTMSFSTNIYEMDENGEYVNVYNVNQSVQRLPVDLEKVPQHTRDAFVCAEDERFYLHEGIDFKRTAGAIANMILKFWNSEQGGSTITQQLVKNLTGDDEKSPQRKIREIYRALQLEKSYSKDEILETYINYIGFGGAANGVEMAAKKYFGKTVSELSIAESACLAAIPQNPEVNNPFAGRYEVRENEVTKTEYVSDNFINTGEQANRERMEYILYRMYYNGAITFDEYQDALHEHLIFKGTDEYKALHPEEEPKVDENGAAVTEEKNTTWAVDEALREYAHVLMEQRGITMKRALGIINSGGYQIYTTVDRKMQAYVENKFLDMNNILSGMTTVSRTNYRRDLNHDGKYEGVVNGKKEVLPLQCGFTAIDYDGRVLCTVGMIGKKQGSLGTSFASTEKQQPGSAIKPVTSYGYALYHDAISWGTKLLDNPVITNPETGKPWPSNYSETNIGTWSHAKVNVYKALEVSKNTIPALLVKNFREQVYDFAMNSVGLSLDAKDRDLAPLSVGALRYGVTVKDLVNAFMIYGNGGIFCDAHIIDRVESGDGGVIYQGGEGKTQAVDRETSYVMNKLLQNVINGEQGTGKQAKLYKNGKQIPIAGKTGTTTDWCDKLFVGLNPDFVSGCWFGYEENKEIQNRGAFDTPHAWKNIIGDWITKNWSGKDFPECSTVISGHVCVGTGKIAGDGCTKGAVGYWKSTNAPYCDNRELGLQQPKNYGGSNGSDGGN